ncbi:hypothetical protein AB0C52_12785 [Streptomyces sp. NPDC048717]|uniref:hypothetical protein n=1 Tax=Streptomyces sp. NPDC048717 TaxID=3154928 RepID=UPI003441A0DD
MSTHPTDTADATAPQTSGLFSRTQVYAAIRSAVEMVAEESERSPYDSRFRWVYAAVMVLLDAPDAPGDRITSRRNGPVELPAAKDNQVAQYSHEQATAAVDHGIGLAARYDRRTLPDDIDNFLANAAPTLLDNPQADFAMIAEEYYSVGPSTLRSWMC